MKRLLLLPLLLPVQGLAQANWVNSTLPQYKIGPAIAPKLQAFSLRDVRLLDGPFKHAQELDTNYLLFLEPDRFLHNFRLNAGLTPKAEIYGGWENAGVAGQTLGHYLSALSMMFQATADPRIKDKLDYTIDELAMIQEKNGDGYVSGIPDGRAIFNDVKAGQGDAVLRGWVPWYTMHKLFAGLRDAYMLTGNEKAKTTLIKLADWAIDTTANLDDTQWQKMLAQEHGGMNEVLADVYAITGDTKYLDLARKFSHRLILDPLSEKKDKLDGFHANTQIPKVIGFERIYELTGDRKYGDAAQFFWQTVTNNRSYATGGNSDGEHFFPPAETHNHLTSSSAENCNVYNMLKLTRNLYESSPQDGEMEFYERALFNQILSSQDPVKGGFNYLNSLKPGGFKVYSNPTTAFWCCVGTGLENHSKYGDTIYFHDDNALQVNLFIASRLQWRAKGVTVTQTTRFPDEDTTTFTIDAAQPTQFALKLRQPLWTSGAKLLINGKAQPVTGKPGSYETIARQWKSGDKVTWQLPMALHSEAVTGDPRVRAILYGPIVLAADMGREGMDKISTYVDNQLDHANDPAPPVSSVVSSLDWSQSDAWAKQIARAPGANLSFQTRGLMKPADVKLIPFSRAQNMRYNVYWNVYSPAQWQGEIARVAAQQESKLDIQARTVDEIEFNVAQSETNHALKGERSNAGDYNQTHWRDAGDGGYFSFDMTLPPTGDSILMTTYLGTDGGNRDFDILVDGQKIATQALRGDKSSEFYNVFYPIPLELTKGKAKVNVRFQAKPGAVAGGAFGARILRANP